MIVRTYHWADRIIPRWRFAPMRIRRRRRSNHFRYGNAGDVFCRDIVRTIYQADAENISGVGRRLLAVGSIADRMLPGDVACGIGARRSFDVPLATNAPCRVIGVRGPLTLRAMRDAGHDVRALRFIGDPGVLVRLIVGDDEAIGSGRQLFIPHYRERYMYPRRIRHDVEVVDVDQSPLDVARHILGAELIYASSLHGLIFAHALDRPCVLVQPRTVEPEFKYRDYFASQRITWRTPAASINEAIARPTPTLGTIVRPAEVAANFPTARLLTELGIMVAGDVNSRMEAAAATSRAT